MNTLRVDRKSATSILAAYVLSRLICSAFVYFGHISRCQPYKETLPLAWRGVDNWWLNPWTTYDSYWYLTIARNGYEAHTTAFFPFYPMLLKLFGDDFSTMALGGTIMSHLFFFIALVLIFKLTEKEHDQTIANITIWTICFFPSSVYFSAVYTESLFLALTAGLFLAARHEKWELCTLLAFAAALTRNPGFLLALALFYEIQKGPPSLKNSGAKIYVPLSPVLAFLAVQIYYWWRFGSPWAGVVSQIFFSRQIMWPWQPLINDFLALFQPDQLFGYYFFTLLSLVITILALAFTCYGYRIIPLSYILLIGGITLMNLTYARTLTPSTISGIRYMGVLFPFSQLIAISYYKLHRYRLIGPILVSVQIFILIVYSYNFGLKYIF